MVKNKEGREEPKLDAKAVRGELQVAPWTLALAHGEPLPDSDVQVAFDFLSESSARSVHTELRSVRPAPRGRAHSTP